MAQHGRSGEEAFNQALGKALRTTTARWQAMPGAIKIEQTGTLAGAAGKRPDILILDSSSPPVVIESSFSQTDADKDALARLGEKIASTGQGITMAASVAIAAEWRTFDLEEMTKRLTESAPLDYALHQQPQNNPDSHRRWPCKGFITGTVYDFAQFISAALPKEDIAHVGESVALQVDQAAERLDQHLSVEQQQRIAELSQQRTAFKGLRTTMVLWLNALLTQQRLHTQGVGGIPPLDFTSNAPPVPSDQAKIWRSILKLNWHMIFAPAVTVLEEAGNFSPAATASALQLLIRASEQIEIAQLGTQINIGAELFPKLSEDRKEAAAFYTQPSTAELLAALAIRPDDADDWASKDFFTRHKLADLACGTGTLLRAGYRRICAFHERGGGTLETLQKLHSDAMEQGLIGTDISPVAAHLTASSLAAIGSGKPYGETEIGWLRVGGGWGNTGALEYLASSSQTDLLADIAGRSHGRQERGNSVKIIDWSADWVLMNPPYSRTRGGQSAFDVAGLQEAERKACQKRWGALISGAEANKTAGMAASFLALAERKVKRGGRIGFVLPLTAALADSWTVSRQMVERWFTDITAVAVAAGQALGDEALSADTGMEEMLLTAQRRNDSEMLEKPAPIRCVVLHRAPMRVGEAGEIARAIDEASAGLATEGLSRPIRVGDDEIGQVALFRTNGKGRPWAPLGVVHTDLALAADKLAQGLLGHLCQDAPLGPKMTTIGKLFDVGPTHHLIGHLKGKKAIGAFELHPVKDANDAIGRSRFLWAADAKNQQSLMTRPTHKGIDLPTSDNQKDMRAKSSTLFYARNMRWTSQKLLAATTEHDAMGGRAWAALRHDNSNIRKSFALWANSTLGMIVHWTQGQRTHAGRSTTQMGAIRKIPCPDFPALEDSVIALAAKRFDELAGETLRPACQAHADSVRIRIDQAVLEMFAFARNIGSSVEDSRSDYNSDRTKQSTTEHEQVIAMLRQLWCAEPSVHGSNQAALMLLQSHDSS